MLAADYVTERLVRAGVRHVFGVGGANIEDLFSAVQRRRPVVRAVLGKHEHAAGAAADAYARSTGGLGVVMVTSGGGAMNLVHALAEAHASAVPVLALVGEPPSDLQGRGAFQDSSGRGDTIDGAAVFAAVSRRCIRVREAAEIPEALELALAAAMGPRPGPAVLLVAKDLQRGEIDPIEPRPDAPGSLEPDRRDVDEAVERLACGPVVVVAGPAIARRNAQGELAMVVERLDAEVAVTPDARDAFDNRDPRFVGVAGAMGGPRVTEAFTRARACLLVGTRLPLLARQGIEASVAEMPVLSIGDAPPYVAGKHAIHWTVDVRAGMRALLDVLPVRTPRPRAPAQPRPRASEGATLRIADAMATLSAALPEESTVLIDAGNTGAATIHHVEAPRRGRWLVAMGMAGMGWTFGAAIGAACASGRRCVVVAGDGAFYMHGLEIHTAVEHRLPITYVVLDNAAHGMCLVRERLLLGENAGYNAFRRARIGAGTSAMFPGTPSFDCDTVAALERALARSFAEPGPCVIAVGLAEVEVPPFAAFAAAVRAGITVVDRGRGGAP
jgi:acetolactate synthase-1/2/3 large subunit